MKEKLIEFDTALLAKEKGFDVDANFYYYYGSLANFPKKSLVSRNWKEEHLVTNTTCSAVSQALLQRWLREKHNLLVESTHYTAEYFTYKIYRRRDIIKIIVLGGARDTYDTYEEALEKGLQHALKLI